MVSWSVQPDCAPSRRLPRLVQVFLDHGVEISTKRLVAAGLGPHINPLVRPTIVYDCTEVEEIILQESEDRLHRKLTHDLKPHKEDLGHLYYVATKIEWAKGCEILFAHGIDLRGSHHIHPRWLLGEAILSGSLSAIQFWLDMRPKLTVHELAEVGTLEDGLHCCSSIHEEEAHDLILRAIICQRKQLQDLLLLHGVKKRCCESKEKLLDAHARCAIDGLTAAGVVVPLFLWPSKRSIYHYDLLGAESIAVDKYFEAGFRDISAADFTCSGEHEITPLIWSATHNRKPMSERIEETQNFLTRGADLFECWPDSSVTAAHWLGWGLGEQASKYDLGDINAQFLENLLAIKTPDSCTCPCSPTGCTPLSCVGKNFDWMRWLAGHYPQYATASQCAKSYNTLMKVLENTSRNVSNRWFNIDLIRAITFSSLGLRHTCCDMSRTTKYGRPNLTLRYSPKQLRRIQEEDHYLVERLEELVPLYASRYDRFQGDLKAFLEKCLYPGLQEVLRNLKKEDSEQYAQGRREAGVIMWAESCPGSDEVRVDNDTDGDSDLKSCSDDDI